MNTSWKLNFELKLSKSAKTVRCLKTNKKLPRCLIAILTLVGVKPALNNWSAVIFKLRIERNFSRAHFSFATKLESQKFDKKISREVSAHRRKIIRCWINFLSLLKRSVGLVWRHVGPAVTLTLLNSTLHTFCYFNTPIRPRLASYISYTTTMRSRQSEASEMDRKKIANRKKIDATSIFALKREVKTTLAHRVLLLIAY